jgi:hypothetical protein
VDNEKLNRHDRHGERDFDLESALLEVAGGDFSVVELDGALCDR